MPVFYGEALWWLLPSLVSLLSSGKAQPESTYPCILKVIDQVPLITAPTSLHLPKLVSNDLTIKSDLVLTNRIGENGVRG